MKLKILNSIKPETIDTILKDYFFVDLHNHFSNNLTEYGDSVDIALQAIFETLSHKTNIISVCERSKENNDTLRFSKLKHYFETTGLFKISGGNKFIRVTHKNRSLIFFKSQEIEIGPYHIVVVGSNQTFTDYTTPLAIHEIRKAIKHEPAFLVFAHPFSIKKDGFIPFRIGSHADESQIQSIASNCDLIEGFNAHNILWMKRSNEKAMAFARRIDKPIVADSDAHFSLSEMACSGTYIHKKDISLVNDSVFFRSLKKTLVKRNHIPLERYVSLWGFYNSIFKKHLKAQMSSQR